MRLETLWLSLDPYMRGRMSAVRSYAEPVSLGDVMTGQAICRVGSSRHPDWAPGTLVLAGAGWCTASLSTGAGLVRLDPAPQPITAALGVLGMPGLTAYAGLAEIGKPKASETVAVAAATGPVGSAVGQIAKKRGCRTVGIAGRSGEMPAARRTFPASTPR